MEDEDILPYILLIAFLITLGAIDVAIWQCYGKQIGVLTIGLEIYILGFTKVGEKILNGIFFIGKGLCFLISWGFVLFFGLYGLYLFIKWFFS